LATGETNPKGESENGETWEKGKGEDLSQGDERESFINKGSPTGIH